MCWYWQLSENLRVYVFRHVRILAKSPISPPFCLPVCLQTSVRPQLDIFIGIYFKTCREKSKFFKRFSAREKSLLFVTSVHPSVRMYHFGSNWMRFGEIWYQLIFFFKSVEKTPNLVKIEQKYWALYMKTPCTFILLTAVHSFVIRQRTVACPWHQKLPEGASVLLFS